MKNGFFLAGAVLGTAEPGTEKILVDLVRKFFLTKIIL